MLSESRRAIVARERVRRLVAPGGTGLPCQDPVIGPMIVPVVPRRASRRNENFAVKNTNNPKPQSMALVSAGLELAGSFFLPGALGWYVDSVYQWEKPWGFLVGGILGFSLGMYNFMRAAKKLQR